jgi:hypothetical protein
MNDGRTAPKLPLLGLPLPISFALVVALLGLIGIRIPGAAKPSGDAPPSMLDVVVDEPDDASLPAAIEILQEAFGMDVSGNQHAPSAGPVEGGSATSRTSRHGDWLKRIPVERLQGMRCVIGILPDPNDSHFQLSFDTGMESLVRAFQGHGYVRDRYRLFWQSDLRALRGGKEGEARQARRYASPVLFRSQGNSAMLLLVGETPNTGVHREALHDAMDFAAALRSVAGKSPLDVDDFLIMGPCYSGSCPGLRDAIEDWATIANKQINARVISGIATAVQNRKVFTENRGGQRLAEIRFSAAVATDDLVLEGILNHFIVERSIRPEQIAILSETDTSYGAELLKTASKGEASGVEKIRTLTYPMMLSRMRSEYNRRGIKQEVNEPQAEQLKRRNLDLSQDISPYAVDVLPSFSTSSVAVADRILESLLETIREEEIKVVGIMGTDVTDKLFLAQRIRQLVPNVQLFTLEADFLFTHSAYSQLFRGTVVGSSYPLYPPTQRWSLSKDLQTVESVAYRPVQFSSDTSEGIYNATVQLLNGPKEGKEENRRPLLDYGPLFGNVRTDHSADDEAAAPLGWLSVVGETRLWPLRQIGRGVADAGTFGAKTLGRHHYVNSPKFLATGLACGMALAMVACFIFWNRVRPATAIGSKNGYSAASSLLAGMRWLRLGTGGKTGARLSARDEALLFDRTVYASIFFTSLTLILVCVCAPTYAYLIEFAPTRSFAWSTRIVVCLGVMLSALVATTVAALSAAITAYRYEYWRVDSADADDARWVAARNLKVDRAVRAGMLTLLVFGVSVMLVATAMAAVDSVANRSNYHPSLTAAIALFVVRCSNFSDLVNPLFPIAFLAAMFAIWSYCSLKRLLLVSTYDFGNPLAPPVSDVAADSSDGYYASQLRRVETGYRSVLENTGGYVSLGMRVSDWVAGFGLLMFLAHMVLRDWVPTCEGRGYDFVVRVLYLGAIVMILGLMLRARNLFRSTEELLRWVDHLPLAKRFAAIPIEVRSKASDVLYATHPKVDDYHLMVRQIQKLTETRPEGFGHADDAFRQDSQALVLRARAGMDAAFRQQRRPEEDAHLGRAIADFSSQRLMPYLLAQWDRSGSDGTDVTVDQTESKPADPAAAWLRDAETLIAVQIVHQIRVVFLYARTLLGGVIAMYLCLLWATNSYPFQPGQMMNFTCLMLMLWMVIIVFNAILRFNRNPILSRINGTEPNRLTFDSSFWVPMISYIGLPILAVLATLLPTVGRSLFSWTAMFSQMLGSGG